MLLTYQKGRILVLNNTTMEMAMSVVWSNDDKFVYFNNPDGVHSTIQATHYIPRTELLSIEKE